MTEEYSFVARTKSIPPAADFCLRLEDDCMEPWLKKGERVYVDRSEAPEEMQPGVFWYRGQILCRQWCEDSLGTGGSAKISPLGGKRKPPASASAGWF